MKTQLIKWKLYFSCKIFDVLTLSFLHYYFTLSLLKSYIWCKICDMIVFKSLFLALSSACYHFLCYYFYVIIFHAIIFECFHYYVIIILQSATLEICIPNCFSCWNYSMNCARQTTIRSMQAHSYTRKNTQLLEPVHVRIPERRHNRRNGFLLPSSRYLLSIQQAILFIVGKFRDKFRTIFHTAGNPLHCWEIYG